MKHEDPNSWCIGCGHCVAACPAETITYDAQERAPELSGKLPSFDDTARMLMGQRTVRKYEDREVPRLEIGKILEVARYASSGHNAQPCEYLAVTDRTIIKMMVDLTMKSMKSFRGLMRMRFLLRPFLPASFYEILNDRGTALGIDDMARRQDSGEDVIFFDAPVVRRAGRSEGTLPGRDSHFRLSQGEIPTPAGKESRQAHMALKRGETVDRV